ncbi:TDT family transporter [Dactylosporangium sp. CA-233914]|uniref:TDT family transporter n=1 Tax=Dactylosporangium sp. CA-233914 TaxID=3239934 RepID=UPI003D8F1079
MTSQATAGYRPAVVAGRFKVMFKGVENLPLRPNRFAAVMGTGIVANAAPPALHPAAAAVWVLASGLLAGMTVDGVRRARAGGLALDPATAPFWGAPPMALMTVGAGTLLFGPHAAVPVAVALWLAGTVLGLVTTVAVPLLLTNRRGPAVTGAWLMPVVPPMVSAATGAPLIAHFPAAVRPDALLCCYALFGVSLFAAVAVIAQLWGGLLHHGPGEPRTVPTLWIVLGPLGQSVTAAHALAGAAHGVLPPPYAPGAEVFALLYGVPVLGFALVWLAFAAAVTVGTARRPGGLPFTPAWWAFTFPVGTCVTGAAGLAAQTGSPLLAGVSIALYLLLVTAWAGVGTRTLLAGGLSAARRATVR